MPSTNIAFYAHHHGSGHLKRALAIAGSMSRPLTIFTSAPPPDQAPAHVTVCRLAADIGASTIDTPLSTTGLHYAPLGVGGITERMAQMANWFHSHSPCLLVVDVSVEVALFARLCGIPTIYIRQNGERTDLPHTLAYASASQILAPFPSVFHYAGISAAFSEKTVHTGFISRYTATESTFTKPLRRTVVVLIGQGGTSLTHSQIRSAAAATPEWCWTVLGPIDSSAHSGSPDNLRFVGTVQEPLDHLQNATVVVGSAGDSVVAEMAGLRCRYIAIPEDRPFDEQQHTAETLARHGVAIHAKGWPDAAKWPDQLNRALALAPEKWDTIAGRDGARCAAETIQNTADALWHGRKTLAAS